MFTHPGTLHALIFALATLLPSFAIADSNDARIIEQAIEVLANTKTGAASAKYLRSGRVSVKFAKCNVNLNKPVAACFTARNKSIYLSPSLRSAPVSVLASFLAHEASHASRAIQAAYKALIHPKAQDRQKILIDEEMIAYKIQAHVWRELRDQQGPLAKIFVLDRQVASMDDFTDKLLASDENQRRNYISLTLGYAKEYRKHEKAALSLK